MVIGGDGEPFGAGFTQAEDVLIGIARRGVTFERVGIGGYPEGNPVFKTNPTEVLLRKQYLAQELGTDMEIVTQMCFDVDVLIDWITKIRQSGVFLPVVVGVPGSLKIERLIQILPTLGITDSLAFIKSKPKLVQSLTGGAFSGFKPNNFLKELATKSNEYLNIRGVSIYTLGNITGSVNCLTELFDES